MKKQPSYNRCTEANGQTVQKRISTQIDLGVFDDNINIRSSYDQWKVRGIIVGEGQVKGPPC